MKRFLLLLAACSMLLPGCATTRNPTFEYEQREKRAPVFSPVPYAPPVAR